MSFSFFTFCTSPSGDNAVGIVNTGDSFANQFHHNFSGGANNSLGLAFALLQASPEEFVVVWRRFALLCSGQTVRGFHLLRCEVAYRLV